MNDMVRHPQLAGHSASDPIRRFLERVLDDAFRQPGAADASSVVTSQWAPRVDIREEAREFVILADLPGVAPEAIDVQMENGILTIKGERRDEAGAQGGNCSLVERVHGTFHRRFALPDSADPDGITASYENGVVTVIIPVAEKAKPRKVEISATAPDPSPAIETSASG